MTRWLSGISVGRRRLPGGAVSVRSLEQQRRFPSGAQTPAVTLIRRDGGLTASDLGAIKRFAAGLNREPVDDSLRSSPPIRSRDAPRPSSSPHVASNDATALTNAVDAPAARSSG